MYLQSCLGAGSAKEEIWAKKLNSGRLKMSHTNHAFFDHRRRKQYKRRMELRIFFVVWKLGDIFLPPQFLSEEV